VTPSPEIYGGSAGFYDLGPLGKLLKNRLEDRIRSSFVKNNFWEVECPTVSPAIVWKASGHLDGFIDPVVQCTKCEQVYRADTLIEEQAPDADIKSQSPEELTKSIKDLGIIWTAPWRVDVSDVAKPASNHLEITVVNLWPNRLIGDASLPPDQRVTRTNITKHGKDSPLLPSGLLGPVTLKAETYRE